MTASRSARERKAAVQAGPLARLRIEVDQHERFVYKIGCTECRSMGHRAWSTHRPGQDNGFMAAMDRWVFHLAEKHPDADAPCLAYLPDARQRLHDQRVAADAADS